MTSTDVRGNVPRSYFSDEAIYRRELHEVFGKSWIFVAHESEIPRIGDYVTRLMGSEPVIVSRSEDGPRVMLNSCTHRGTQVCKVAYGNSTTFRCGYHGWAFGHDGRLKGVPGKRTLYAKDFDFGRLGLRQASVASRHGMIFATWDEDASAFGDALGDFAWYFDALFGWFPGGMEVYGGVRRARVRGNWKLHAENMCGDGYHLQVSHNTMFAAGVMGDQALSVEGWVVNGDGGHTIRAQYLAEEGIDRALFGYESELVEETLRVSDPEVRKFREGTTVIHGLVFPNLGFITTSPNYLGDDATGTTAYTQLRTITPIDLHHHEIAYWTLVPKAASEAWKAKSHLFSTRMFTPSSFLEADDVENFRRIDAGLGEVAGRDVPYNYELGLNAAENGKPAPWSGPGRIVGQDLTESNHRSFVSHYLNLVEGA
jgi:nitrite reductase/ring-hydroxylating ferredoxin subunit